jgi:hypothetical protein
MLVFGFEPDQLVFNWTRGETNKLSAGNYLANNTYLMTNNIVVGEDLSGCGIQIRAGTFNSNRLFNATIYDTSNFWCFITIPTVKANNDGSFQGKIQLTITQGVNQVTYGGQKVLNVQNKLE